MAKRTFKKRGARRGGKTNYTVGGSVAHLAKKAMEGVKFLKTIVNVEHKYYDLAVVPTNLDWGGVVGNFHAIAQGTTALTRNGDSIKVSSLDIGISIGRGSTQTSTVPYRLMILRGCDERTTAPTGATLLASSGTYQVVNCPRAVDTTQNYKVIWEKQGVISGLTGDKDSFHRIDAYIPIDEHVKYVTGGTTAENGGLYYAFFCDAASATTVPYFTMYSRTRFIDN